MTTQRDRVLAAVLSDADHCHGITVNEGIQDACGKPPVAIVDDTDLWDGCYWPACAYHANRWGRGRCVPLSKIREATR